MNRTNNAEMDFTMNHLPPSSDKWLSLMTPEEVRRALRFHRSFPQYEVTPLHNLKNMARYLGIGGLYVKDESYRFGLNAFKVLGGSYAMARYIAKKTGRSVDDLPYQVLSSPELREDIGATTFYTATDGNHGRGVAWAAQKLGQKAVVHMPKGTTQTRLENIKKLGADVDILDLNYDDCVRQAAKEAAATPHGVMVQDTAWDGYEEIPSWIMQGYGTMAMEAGEQLKAQGVERPTHIFVQAGVGSLAGAVVGYFANLYKDNPPKFIVVEASAAACLYKGAAAGDGKPRIVGGDLDTIMAGLACGEPNTISWDILKNHVTTFVAADDPITVRGMRMLAAPLKGDAPIVSGESGAVPFGTLATIMLSDECKDIRAELGLDDRSQVLVFSTEGDTDPERYKNIVWRGLNK